MSDPSESPQTGGSTTALGSESLASLPASSTPAKPKAHQDLKFAAARVQQQEGGRQTGVAPQAGWEQEVNGGEDRLILVVNRLNRVETRLGLGWNRLEQVGEG